MQEAITTQVEVTHDPAVTAAIREIKSRIKALAESQKIGKKAFREAMSKWDKSGNQRSHTVPRWNDQSETITALFVFYGKLRQTKRPHFPTSEAYDKYYNDVGVGYIRNMALKKEQTWLETNHPVAFAKLEAQYEEQP